jgi:hypothetical protein
LILRAFVLKTIGVKGMEKITHESFGSEPKIEYFPVIKDDLLIYVPEDRKGKRKSFYLHKRAPNAITAILI